LLLYFSKTGIRKITEGGMYRKFAKFFGILFIVIGILGFIPGITYHNKLLGLFMVNTTHNFIHLIAGAIGYWVSRMSMRASQLYLQIFGIIFAAIGLLGFGYGRRDIFGMIANNIADAWLHLIIGIIFLYVGFLNRPK